ncbi:hypothetical protein PVK61_16725, partial [Aliivibrio sp. S2MY1]|nr:hypothetical protein [Aliivibrio sp. S2MY1]
MKWSLIRSIGDSKIVQSSFIWLLIVPISARLLSNVDDVINMTVFGSNVNLTTSLPFSWQLLFGAACFFTIANIIYNAFCPEIFRQYKNYSEFKEHGKTLLQVHSAMKVMVWCNRKPGVKPDYVKYLSSYFKNYCKQPEMDEENLDYAVDQFDNLERSNMGQT